MNDRSRKYTNVILTIIAVLLAIIAFKPSDSILPTAEAQNPNLIQREERNTQQVVAFGDIYLEAARRLGVDPRDCLVFEDALSGVRAGKAAGCRVVAIPDQRFSDEDLQAFRDEADMVVPDLWHFDGTPFGLQIDMQKTKVA